jgi:hypothetical protein
VANRRATAAVTATSGQWKEEFDVSCMHHNGGFDSGWRDLDRWPDHARRKPLFHEGKIVSQKRGLSVSDGPFAESKEAIGGFFLLEVGSLDEAAEIAKDFPGLEYGATVEVRPVAPECMVGDARLRASA